MLKTHEIHTFPILHNTQNLNPFSILLLNLNFLTRTLTRTLVWRYARACFRALDHLAQRVCGQIALNLKTHHAYFSRGVQKVKNSVPTLRRNHFFFCFSPSVALLFSIFVTPPLEYCYFSFRIPSRSHPELRSRIATTIYSFGIDTAIKLQLLSWLAGWLTKALKVEPNTCCERSCINFAHRHRRAEAVAIQTLSVVQTERNIFPYIFLARRTELAATHN